MKIRELVAHDRGKVGHVRTAYIPIFFLYFVCHRTIADSDKTNVNMTLILLLSSICFDLKGLPMHELPMYVAEKSQSRKRALKKEPSDGTRRLQNMIPALVGGGEEVLAVGGGRHGHDREGHVRVPVVLV